MIERVTVRLKDILPSDLPRQDSWFARKMPSGNKRTGTINLDDYGIKLIRIGSDKYTVQDGNHFLSLLVQEYGEDCLVEANLEVMGPRETQQWAYQVKDSEKEGSGTFTEFIRNAISGRFWR